MKLTRKISIILALALVVNSMTLINTKSADAATKTGQAKKAYMRLLSNYKTNPEFRDYAKYEQTKNDFSFTLCDITGDGIPELILREYSVDPCIYWIYTYHNGNLKKLKKMDYYSGGMLFEIYPKVHIVCGSEGDSYRSDFIYYKLSEGKIKIIARTKGKNRYIKGKKVAKNKYKKFVTKLKKGKKISESNGTLKFRSNNAINRNKYLK